MLLALDIGNSTIAAALFDGDKLVAHEASSMSPNSTESEVWENISQVWSKHQLPAKNISAVGISSVVPSTAALILKQCKNELRLVPFIVNPQLLLGITIRYANPEQLGSDRICTAVAGFQKHGGPLIIIDFGTATTYGVIDEKGDFLGGAISLGVRSTAEALHLRTAQLPAVELRIPQKAVNTTTAAAIQSGVMFGALDALHGMVERLQSELGSRAKVIATGGLSHLMAQHTKIFDAVEPTLVLEGIRIIGERIKNKAP
ncbi:MAG: type III pantothenate kinase [Ignavibacteriae bacterium]|nr:type III pantothenate kinase [Ignavibacteriota bacterium]